MQTPTQGRTVMAVGHLAAANGTDTCPAVITRVWSEREDGAWCTNATVLPDAEDATRRAWSTYLHENEEAARASLTHPEMTALYWPERV